MIRRGERNSQTLTRARLSEASYSEANTPAQPQTYYPVTNYLPAVSILSMLFFHYLKKVYTFFQPIRFGGDPNQVTIFGGTAGGVSVALMMLSPLSHGLYKNVIMQGGNPLALSSAMEKHEAYQRAR